MCYDIKGTFNAPKMSGGKLFSTIDRFSYYATPESIYQINQNKIKIF
jgi:hypothetical protein